MAGCGEKGKSPQLTWISIFSLRTWSSWVCLSRSSDSSSRSDPRLDSTTLWDCSTCSFWKVRAQFYSDEDLILMLSFIQSEGSTTSHHKLQLVFTGHLCAYIYSHKCSFPSTRVPLRAQCLRRRSRSPWTKRIQEQNFNCTEIQLSPKPKAHQTFLPPFPPQSWIRWRELDS